MTEILHTVDFISVTYNHPSKMVQEMVDSIRTVMQYCPHLEYKIIIQDNSDTKKEKINVIERCDNVNFSSTNLGYCGGNNTAIEHSSAEYIVIVNPDIKINNSLCVDWMIGTAKLYDCIVGRLVGTNKWYTYSSSFPTDKKYDPKQLPFFYDQPTLPKPGNWRPFKYIDGSLMCFNKKIWKDIGGFDEDIFPGYFGENTFVFNAFLKGYKIRDARIEKYYDHTSVHKHQKMDQIKIWSQQGRELFYEKYALINWAKFLEYLG